MNWRITCSVRVAVYLAGSLLFLSGIGRCGVPIRFHTDRPGFVSLNLYRGDGTVVRQLLAAEQFAAGDHEVDWDGRGMPLDSGVGDALPAGEYTWKAIFHEGLGLRLRGWACNAGAKPWETKDGRGEWGGDAGAPSAVTADDQRVYLGWALDTRGNAVAACDLDGNVVWSERRGAIGGCKALAVDDGVVYVLGGGAGEDAEGGAIYRLRASDGASVPWPNGVVDLKIASLWPADGKPGPHRADAMAVRNGHIYLSFTGPQFMAVLDAKSGVYLETVVGAPPGAVDATPTKTELPGKPGVLVDADFAVTVLNGNVLGKLLFNHDPLWVVGSDLTPLENHEPITALTMLGDAAKFHRHDVFLGLGQPFHQVQARPILRPEGFTWIAGRSGGRSLLGPWQPDGLRNIKAVALDGAGHLWVAEGDGVPKRFSVWTTDGANGKLAQEFFGSAEASARGGAIDPGDPDLMVGQGCEWRLEPRTGRAACLGVITREGMDSARFCDGPDGRVYLAVAHSENGPISIFERMGDGDYRMQTRIFLADADMKELSPSAAGGIAGAVQTVVWSDENGDGERQPGEMHAAPGVSHLGGWSLPVAPDLTLCGTNERRPQRGFRWKVTGWTACGAPLYDIAHPSSLPAFGESSPDGKLLLQREENGKHETNLRCWDAAHSKVRWTYPVDSGAGVARQAPASLAGRIRGLVGVCGCVNLPAPLGNVWVIATQSGDWHLLTEDGFYLSRLFESDLDKVQWPGAAVPGADMSHAGVAARNTHFGGAVTQDHEGKVYIQAGDTAFWNLRLTGLATVHALAGGKVTLGDRKGN